MHKVQIDEFDDIDLESVKTCNTCKWCSPLIQTYWKFLFFKGKRMSFNEAKCLHPKSHRPESSTINLVDGTVTIPDPYYYRCDTMRGSDSKCGIKGDFWEPKDET